MLWCKKMKFIPSRQCGVAEWNICEEKFLSWDAVIRCDELYKHNLCEQLCKSYLSLLTNGAFYEIFMK
jgi:hypothetical protein